MESGIAHEHQNMWPNPVQMNQFLKTIPRYVFHPLKWQRQFLHSTLHMCKAKPFHMLQECKLVFLKINLAINNKNIKLYLFFETLNLPGIFSKSYNLAKIYIQECSLSLYIIVPNLKQPTSQMIARLIMIQSIMCKNSLFLPTLSGIKFRESFMLLLNHIPSTVTSYF